MADDNIDKISDLLEPDESEKEITPEEAEELMKQLLAMDLKGRKIECFNLGGDMWLIEAIVKSISSSDCKTIVIEWEKPTIVEDGKAFAEENKKPFEFDRLEFELFRPPNIGPGRVWLDIIPQNIDHGIDALIIWTPSGGNKVAEQ